MNACPDQPTAICLPELEVTAGETCVDLDCSWPLWVRQLERVTLFEAWWDRA